jgi:tetratricopeptide (TPR) repeat protein
MGTNADALRQARQLHEAGELGQAESLYGQLLEADPAQSEVLFLLGVVCGQQNRLDEALAYYRRALALRPSDAKVIFHVGLTCQSLGQQEEAAEHFRHALRIRPDLAAAYFSLGNTHLHFGQLDEAIRQYRQAIRLQPTLGPAFLNLANALQQQGHLQEAAVCLRDCLSRQPKYAEGHFNLGNVLVAMKRPQEAAVHYQEAIRLQPSFVPAYNNRGNVALALGQVDEAIEYFEQAARLQPDYAEACVNLGGALMERLEVAAAVKAYQQALRVQPDHARAHNNLAEAYLDLGDAREAQAHFREAVRISPDFIRPLLHLSANGFYSAAEPGVDEIKARLTDSRLSRDSASQLHFILGYLLDRAGAADEAFEHFRQGNALRRSLLQENGKAFDPAANAEAIDRLIAFFSSEFFQQTQGFGLMTEVPVFIVGMPRSGSTLIEQILSQHSRVHGAGEIKDVTRLVADLSARLGGADQYPECLAGLNGATAREFAEGHLRQLTRRDETVSRVTDKMLDNFFHLGLLAVLFPQARVIHCQRDPRDVCLSCYFQFFRGLRFTWDLNDLARCYRDYERLMTHWRHVLPIPMLEVVYEDVVADLESESRKIVAFCGIDWEERCLRFHENERMVRTMSRVQVRQPLYTSSVGRWRRYEAHLAPLLRSMGQSPVLDPAGGSP